MPEREMPVSIEDSGLCCRPMYYLDIEVVGTHDSGGYDSPKYNSCRAVVLVGAAAVVAGRLKLFGSTSRIKRRTSLVSWVEDEATWF